MKKADISPHLHLHKTLGPTKTDAHHCKTLKNKLTNKYIDKIQNIKKIKHKNWMELTDDQINK